MSQIDKYEAGMVRVSTQCSPLEDCEIYSDDHQCSLGADPPIAFLPHSCGYWNIGGPDAIRALISDLNSALERIGE